MMRMLARKFNHLRCTYSVLLRLCNKDNHVQGMIGALSERGLGNHSTTWTSYVIRQVPRNLHQIREYAVLPVDCQRFDQLAADDSDKSTKPESIRENVYAHNLFLNSINYSLSVMRPITAQASVTNEKALTLLKMDWSRMTSQEVTSAIKKLSYNINKNERIDSSEYKNAFDALCVEKLNNNDLMTVIRHLTLFTNFRTHNFYQDLCRRLDAECVKRFMQLKTNDMLLLCDMIHQMTRNNKSQFIWYAMRKLGNKPNQLTSKQLVQILYFLNVCRKPPINMYEIEYYLERCLNELSINELGIAALGFFKTGTRIRSIQFLHEIMKKTIDEIDIVDSVSIGALLKLIRYSMQLMEISTLQELLKALTPHEPRFTLMSLTHVAHACGKVAIYDEELIKRIVARFKSEVKTARLKDFERFIFVLASLNFDPSNSFYQTMIEELRTTWDTSRAQEISTYPEVASRILGYLAVLGIYPTDLIQRIMMREHIDMACRGNYTYLTREYCVLDYSLRVEVPEYTGPFLTRSLCYYLEKKYFQEYFKTGLAESSRANILFTSVLHACQEVFNTKSDILILRPLPHYGPPDIVFCLDEQNRLMPSKEFLSQFHPERKEIMRVDNNKSKNVRWIALVMAPHGLLIRNTNLPTGLLAAKIRQLSLIGYVPIKISYVSWNEFPTSQERCDYIRKLIFKNNARELSNK